MDKTVKLDDLLFKVTSYENTGDIFLEVFEQYVFDEDLLTTRAIVQPTPDQCIELAKALLEAAGMEAVLTMRGITSADFDDKGAK